MITGQLNRHRFLTNVDLLVAGLEARDRYVVAKAVGRLRLFNKLGEAEAMYRDFTPPSGDEPVVAPV